MPNFQITKLYHAIFSEIELYNYKTTSYKTWKRKVFISTRRFGGIIARNIIPRKYTFQIFGRSINENCVSNSNIISMVGT